MFALGMFLFIVGLAVGFAIPPFLLVALTGFFLCLKAHPDSLQRMMGVLFALAIVGGILQVFIA